MFVLDCSVALAWCLPDEQRDYASSTLDLLLDQKMKQVAQQLGVFLQQQLGILLLTER